MNNEPARILMIDDHPLLRCGLAQLIEIEDGLELVGEGASGVEAIKLAEELDPDLIMLDLNMQGMDGIETLRTLRERGSTCRIVMLTVSDNDEDVVESIRTGADGYLLKDMDPVDIITNIKEASLGKMVISPKLTEVIATALRRPERAGSRELATLTSRELEILKLIAKGMSNKLIARELDISDGTVKVHVKHFLKKLNLRSRVEAAVWMVNHQNKVNS